MTYIDEIHCYLDDTGKPIPSVSQIIKAFMPMDSNIPIEVLEKAAKRGSKIHAICEEIAKGNSPIIEDDVALYINGYLSLDLPKFAEIERGFVKEYAGRIDCETETCVYDIKTQYAKDIKKWTLQLSLYCLAVGKTEAKVIWLKRTGKSEIINIEVDLELAKACFKVFNAYYRESWEKEMTQKVYEYYNNIQY